MENILFALLGVALAWFFRVGFHVERMDASTGKAVGVTFAWADDVKGIIIFCWWFLFLFGRND